MVDTRLHNFRGRRYVNSSMRSVLVFTGLPMTLAAAAAGQTRIGDDVSCSGCRIEVVDRVAVGGDAGPGMIQGYPTAVALDSLGRFWSGFSSEGPIVYSENGEFLSKVGRKGEGPGEFQWVSGLIALPGDSVVVFDGGSNRVTILGDDLQLSRDVRYELDASGGFNLGWPNAVVVRGLYGSPALAGRGQTS